MVRYGNPVLGLYEARLETVIDRNETHHLCPFFYFSIQLKLLQLIVTTILLNNEQQYQWWRSRPKHGVLNGLLSSSSERFDRGKPKAFWLHIVSRIGSVRPTVLRKIVPELYVVIILKI